MRRTHAQPVKGGNVLPAGTLIKPKKQTDVQAASGERPEQPPNSQSSGRAELPGRSNPCPGCRWPLEGPLVHSAHPLMEPVKNKPSLDEWPGLSHGLKDVLFYQIATLT